MTNGYRIKITDDEWRKACVERMRACPVCGSRKPEIRRYIYPVAEKVVRWRGECDECGTKTLRYYDSPGKAQSAWDRCIIIRGDEEQE